MAALTGFCFGGRLGLKSAFRAVLGVFCALWANLMNFIKLMKGSRSYRKTGGLSEVSNRFFMSFTDSDECLLSTWSGNLLSGCNSRTGDTLGSQYCTKLENLGLFSFGGGCGGVFVGLDRLFDRLDVDGGVDLGVVEVW